MIFLQELFVEEVAEKFKWNGADRIFLDMCLALPMLSKYCPKSLAMDLGTVRTFYKQMPPIKRPRYDSIFQNLSRRVLNFINQFDPILNLFFLCFNL